MKKVKKPSTYIIKLLSEQISKMYIKNDKYLIFYNNIAYVTINKLRENYINAQLEIKDILET